MNFNSILIGSEDPDRLVEYYTRVLGEPTMAVDTHVFRVSNRLGIAPGKTPLAVEEGLMKRIPPEYLQHAHHWLILHGRYVCKAQRPRCEDCIISDLCTAPDRILPVTPPAVG